MVRREVFHMPTEVNTRTNVSHTVVNDPFFSGTPKHQFNLRSAKKETQSKQNVLHMYALWLPTEGMMMSTQHTETSGMVTRQITKEVVQRSVVGGATVSKKLFYET